MLRTVAVQRVTDGLGFRSDLASRVILRMQEEQRDLERGKTLPSFLIAEDQTLTLLAGTNSIALPDDFLRRVDRSPRYVSDVSDVSVDIPWRSYEAAYKAYSDSEASGPKVFVLRSSTILVFPEADRDYTITWDYYAKADTLDVDIENAWLANAPELIIGGAGLRMALDIRNAEAQKLFGAMYQASRTTWFNEDVLNDLDDQPMILGANA